MVVISKIYIIQSKQNTYQMCSLVANTHIWNTPVKFLNCVTWRYNHVCVGAKQHIILLEMYNINTQCKSIFQNINYTFMGTENNHQLQLGIIFLGKLCLANMTNTRINKYRTFRYHSYSSFHQTLHNMADLVSTLCHLVYQQNVKTILNIHTYMSLGNAV